jgi:putative flippase GtrA
MLNSKYTFKQETSKSGLAKYCIVYAIGLGIGIGLIYLGQMYTSWSDFYVTLASIVPRTLLVFIMAKISIFKAA